MAGGEQGAHAVTTLLQLTPVRPDVIASWDRDPRAQAAAAKSEPTETEIWDALYPDDPTAAAETERVLREQAKRARRFNDSQGYDNELRIPKAAASKGIEARRAKRARAGDSAAAATDDELFEALFGKPRT